MACKFPQETYYVKIEQTPIILGTAVGSQQHAGKRPTMDDSDLGNSKPRDGTGNTLEVYNGLLTELPMIAGEAIWDSMGEKLTALEIIPNGGCGPEG